MRFIPGDCREQSDMDVCKTL